VCLPLHILLLEGLSQAEGKDLMEGKNRRLIQKTLKLPRNKYVFAYNLKNQKQAIK
jgi:hypothetical protein